MSERERIEKSWFSSQYTNTQSEYDTQHNISIQQFIECHDPLVISTSFHLVGTVSETKPQCVLLIRNEEEHVSSVWIALS